MVALIVGTVLALAALAYVLWPLIAADGRSSHEARHSEGPSAAPEVAPAAPGHDDPVEQEIRRARAQLRLCPNCGPRPEADARYCSSCGARLA